jgi:hypothetical protein
MPPRRSEATIMFAAVAGEEQGLYGSAYLARMVPPPPRRIGREVVAGGIPDRTAASDALSADLKRRGFRFVGPTTAYALMQATGAQTSATGIYVVQGGKRIARVPGTATLGMADFTAKRVVEASPSTIMVRREALLGPIGLVDEAIPGSYGEDWDWLLRAAGVGPVAVVTEPLVEIVWHPGSFFRTRWATIVEALDYLLDKHPVLREDPTALAYIYGRKAFAYAAASNLKVEPWCSFVRSYMRRNPDTQRLLPEGFRLGR